jgi:tRNA (guanine37-N1)-methyltransferase
MFLDSFIKLENVLKRMLAAQTELKKAETVKRFLAKKNLLNTDYLAMKEFGLIYFPIKKKVHIPNAKVVNTKFSFPKKKFTPKVDDLLQDKLTKNQLKLIPRSQEIVGKIMILEIPEKLLKKSKIIAEAYLQANPQIETVVSKDDIHSGEFRLRKVKVLAGKKTKETIHQENGVRIKLDLEKTYFSARSGNERMRISNLVNKGEEVLVMFSGAAPYPMVIGKNSKAKMVYGVEINPLAHAYAAENVVLNNLDGKVRILLGDVRSVLPKLRRKFDRVVMPLPKTGEQFLDLALKKSQAGAIIHLYAFLREEEIPNEVGKIKEICASWKQPVKLLRSVKCGQFSPSVYRICFDLKKIK